MKKRLTSLIFLLFIIFIFSGFKIKNIVAKNYDTAEIVIEMQSGRILHQKNINNKMYMASTTKILTAITIIENCNLSDVVLVKEEDVGIEGSSLYLKAGDKLTVLDLLYGLMLRSGNDCAVALANFCSKNVKDFANLMNNTAKKIGANDSNFCNPHGLHDDNHYTTANDLAKISRYAMNNDSFKDIVSKSSVNIRFISRDYVRQIYNKNKMLTQFEGANGIKTGYTKNAGRCLVSSAKQNNMQLICVVLNCPPMFERSKALLKESFDNYNLYNIIESENVLGFVNDLNTNKEYGLHCKNDVILPLTNFEFNNLIIKYNYKSELYIEDFNKEIGFVEIYYQNNLIFKEKIYTIV